MQRGVTDYPFRKKSEDQLSTNQPPFLRSESEPSCRTAPSHVTAEIMGMDHNVVANFQALQDYKPNKQLKRIALNVALCIVNILAGCLVPAIADKSRTATLYESRDGELVVTGKRFPYDPATVVAAESLANVLIGMIAMGKQKQQAPLLDVQEHKEYIELTLTYCLGDLAALQAIGCGGGILYLTVGNSRLLFAALASKIILKQELETCQCILLAFMTACIVAFAEAQASGYDSNRSGMFAGLFLVLLKSLLSALAAVLTESRYKTRNVWEANTMLKTQSFLLALVIWALTSLLDKREALQVCPRFEGLPPSVETPCVDYRGWDRWTFAVLVAEVGNGWISVAILKNLSAIAKFVCKGLSAPSLYVSYCLMGRNQFKLALFLPILGLTVSIVFYAKETLKVIYQVYLPTWVPEYRPTFVPHGTSN